MMRAPLLVALALPVAGCGSGGDQPIANAATATPDAHIAQVRALPEAQRNGVLFRAIRDAGRDCQGVTAATEVTANGSPPTWAATCEDGNQWIVAFGANGTATVTNRTELRQPAGGAGAGAG